MAQIIDMEERRKPRPAQAGRAEAPSRSPGLDPFAYVGQLVTPMAELWRAWAAIWGSLWLAPLGLRVNVIGAQASPEARDRVGPRG